VVLPREDASSDAILSNGLVSEVLYLFFVAGSLFDVLEKLGEGHFSQLWPVVLDVLHPRDREEVSKASHETGISHGVVGVAVRAVGRRGSVSGGDSEDVQGLEVDVLENGATFTSLQEDEHFSVHVGIVHLFDRSIELVGVDSLGGEQEVAGRAMV